MRIKRSLTSAAKLVGVGISATLMVVGFANAEPNDNQLVVDGKKLTTKVKGKKDGPLDEVYSGWRFRTSQTQKFQTDDFENPGFPLVDLAEGLWGKVDGTKGKACVSCHQDAAKSMKGVRAAMPKSTMQGNGAADEVRVCRLLRSYFLFYLERFVKIL